MYGVVGEVDDFELVVGDECGVGVGGCGGMSVDCEFVVMDCCYGGSDGVLEGEWGDDYISFVV